jgi:hypothetical protein
MSELLAIRAGEGAAWASDHLAACPFCRHELELLYQRAAALRALPALRPPRDRWDMIRLRAERERFMRRLRRGAWGALALAASVALAVGVGRMNPFPAGGPVAGPSHAEIDSLMAQSRDLEAALRSYDPEGRVLNARAAGIIAELEDRIALVDAGIAQVNLGDRSPGDLVSLWRNRVDLMDALVSVHVSRATYVGF